MGIFYLKINLIEPFEHFRERVSSVIGEVNLPDINSIVCQIIVDNIRIVTLHVEFKHLSVILQELFLRFNSSTSQLVFQIIHHERVFFGDEFVDGFVLEVVQRTVVGL